MDKSYEQSLEKGLTLGSGLRYSASAALMAYGVSRLTLVAVWMFGAPTGGSTNLALRAAAYLFTASIGLASTLLALKVFRAPHITSRHLGLTGAILLTTGFLHIVIELARLLSFPYPELFYSQLSFYADIAYSLLSIYLGVRLLRESFTLGRSALTALALLAVASLLRSVELDYLVLAPFRGTYLNVLWLMQLLYAVSMGLAFTAFVSALRQTPINLHNLTRSREYAVLRGAVLLYGLVMLITFIYTYMLRFDEFMVRAAEYLGTITFVITVYLWPLIDAIFALSIIAFAASMKQVTPPPTPAIQ